MRNLDSGGTDKDILRVRTGMLLVVTPRFAMLVSAPLALAIPDIITTSVKFSVCAANNPRSLDIPTPAVPSLMVQSDIKISGPCVRRSPVAVLEILTTNVL